MTSEPSHAAMEEAAEWFALLRSGDATAEDTQRWHDWLKTSLDHQGAWRYVESVSRNFAPIQSSMDPRRTSDAVLTANTKIRQRRRILRGVVVLGSGGLLSWMGWRHTPLRQAVLAGVSDYRTGTGETREVRMPDGSRIWLNTATAFNADFSSVLRRLELIEGEVLIQTAEDSTRPFVVDTPHGRLRALGTRFTVSLDDSSRTFLAVYQGAVEIRTKDNRVTTVPANKQIYFQADSIGESMSADIAREAWSRGILVARDMTLGEVVAELKRYRHGYLGVSPEVAGLRVFGSFPLEDTDETLSMLEAILPIRVKRTLSWWVSVEPIQKG